MSLVESLDAHARQRPEAPWLFYRRGLDWHWRSYARIADQVARSAQRLSGGDGAGDRDGHGSSAHSADEPVVCSTRQDPDGLATLLTALAAGREVVFEKADPSEVGPVSGQAPWLADCRGALEVFERQAFSISQGLPTSMAARRWLLHLGRDVESLSVALAPTLRELGERPILYAGAGENEPSKWAALAGWALEKNAAWALEPYFEAFAATALWTRPHVLVATAAELATLLPHFDRTARRRSRLRVVVLGGGRANKAERQALADALDCPVVPWPGD